MIDGLERDRGDLDGPGGVIDELGREEGDLDGLRRVIEGQKRDLDVKGAIRTG